MIDLRKVPARVGLLSVLAATLVAAVAYAATSVRYSGTTSQQRPISFTRTQTAIQNFRYHIDDRCPGRKLLYVNNWGFPALTIKNSRFGGKFVAKPPEDATAVIRGTVSGGTVSGTLTDRSRNGKTHKFCSGKATFRLSRAGRNAGSDRPSTQRPE